MRIKAVLAPALLAALAAPASGQPFLGEWTAPAHTPAGEVSETLTVRQTAEGYTITAKLVEPVPEGTPQAGPGTDIVLEGDRFSFTRTLTIPDGVLEITYSGVVSGDTFTGTVNMGFAQAPYTGVRVTKESADGR